MGIREIQVDARSRGRGGTRAGRPTPALRYLAVRVAFSVIIYFELTHDITMECTLIAYWYSMQDALHEVLGSIPNVTHIQIFVFPCMYQVHTKYSSGTCWYILAKVLESKYKQVCTWYGSV